jgi:hypothetical protein
MTKNAFSESSDGISGENMKRLDCSYSEASISFYKLPAKMSISHFSPEMSGALKSHFVECGPVETSTISVELQRQMSGFTRFDCETTFNCDRLGRNI